MEQKTSLLELMEYIHPAELDYQEWVNVGMALKHEGYSVSDWDHWSRQDSGRSCGLGWEIPNPINSVEKNKTKRCPFAILKAGE